MYFECFYFHFRGVFWIFFNNIINILFIFGVQLFNLFSYLSINLNLKSNTVIVSFLLSYAHKLQIYDLNQFDVYFSMHFFICILNVFILIFEEYFGCFFYFAKYYDFYYFLSCFKKNWIIVLFQL